MASNPTSSISDLLHPAAITDLANALQSVSAAPAPPPPGDYLVEITDARLNRASTGTPSLKLQLRIVAGVRTGCKLNHSIWLTTPAARYLKRDMIAIGLSDVRNLDVSTLKGRRSIATVETDAANGATQPKVDSLSAPPTPWPMPSIDPVSPAQSPSPAAATPIASTRNTPSERTSQ